MVLETFAVTGGTPNASRVGNVISVPDPTTVLMVPAATPASTMATASSSDTPSRLAAARAAGGGVGGGARRRAAAAGDATGLAAALGRGDRVLHGRVGLADLRVGERPLPSRRARLVPPMSTRLRGPSASLRDARRSRRSRSRGPRAPWPISDGTIHTLLASPSAIFGIIWRYW